MNTLGDGASVSTDDTVEKSVERILGKATPRPVPSAEETQAVRENVHAEWRALTNKRRSNRRLLSWSIAASILVVVFAGFNAIRVGGITETQVASISKHHIYFRCGQNMFMQIAKELLKIFMLFTAIPGMLTAGLRIAWIIGWIYQDNIKRSLYKVE